MVKVNELKHYGVKRRSGRYPWGSGKDGYQRDRSFLRQVRDLKRQGMTDAEIAKGFGLNSSELAKKRAIARTALREADAEFATRLKEKGYSNTAIAERMGINESSVRSLLDPVLREKSSVLFTTADILAENVDKHGYLDIGSGTEQQLGIAKTKLDTAVYLLQEDGYTVHTIYYKQMGTDNYTIMKVLAPPGTTTEEINKNRQNIGIVTDQYSEDRGHTFRPIEYPASIEGDRVMIRYQGEGGELRDGVVQLRRGVEDIDLGGKNYAQVRIAVDDKFFMKGMAMYADDLPNGVDIVYNTKKPKGTPEEDVYKPLTDDPVNPFKTSIRQIHYIDAEGNEHLSKINIVGYVEGSGEEGGWKDWGKNLSSQILSKQNPALAKQQLGLDLDLRIEEYNEIMSLTNPAVRKALLKPYSDECDAAAEHLKAAALPRQQTHVILPILSLKDNEVYAPNYIPGETVVLIRHPHGGIFEIPELKVNNKNAEARSLIPGAIDAIGINPKVAARLSGADFDGDFVLVIPNKNRSIQTAPALDGLKDFDPITSYPKYEGMKVMDNKTKQHEMGNVSNLITDMTIGGADYDEIARAVRHSMVVIDAEKHELNYQQSYIDNGIAQLKEKYQGGKNKGAATVISKASSPEYVNQRKPGQYITDPETGKTKKVYIDPETGHYLYTETGATRRVYKKAIDPDTGEVIKNPETGRPVYIDTGVDVPKKTKSTKMAETDDAFKLSSGSVMEEAYATYANTLKDLANQARIEYVNTGKITQSASARETYAKEVERLKAALADAYRNKPYERQAQLLANQIVNAKKNDNPDLTPDQIKKIRGQALEEARARYNAKKPNIVISSREWEAIQAGAISNNTLLNILANADIDQVKQHAMPRYTSGMSSARVARAKSMLAAGYDRGDIANALGVSVSTLNKALED